MTSPNIQFRLGDEIINAQVGDNRTKIERHSGQHETIRIQYNPKNPQEVRLAPEGRNAFASIALFAASYGLFRVVRKQQH